MTPDRDKKLEQILHERLRALPDRAAPREMIPGVMAKIAAREARAWWQCPWREWPRAVQFLSLLLVVELVATLIEFRADMAVEVSHLAGRLATTWPLLKTVWMVPSALFQALVLLLRSIQPQFLLIGVAVIAALYFSAVGVGALFYRVSADKN